MKKALRRFGLLLLCCGLLTASACGGTKTPDEGGELTAERREKLAETAGQEEESTLSEAPEAKDEEAPASEDETAGTTIVQRLENKEAQTEEPAEGDYVFSYKGTDIVMFKELDELIDALGPANEEFKAPSCLFDGSDDFVYAYDGFDLNGTELDGEVLLVGVFLNDGTVETREGVKIGDTAAEVREAYGEPDEDLSGSLLWHGETTDLNIVVLNDEVTAISYIARIDEE